MLLTAEHIAEVYTQGREYLSNIMTNKFYRSRYGVQVAAGDTDTDLLLLTWAVDQWDNRNGASNPYTQCQLLTLLENILKKGKELFTCFTCQSTEKAAQPTPETDEPTPPPPPPVEKVEIDWNYFATDPGDPAAATLDKSVSIDHNADFTLPTRQIVEPSWVVIKEPSTETAKTKWFNTVFNNGPISASGTQSWLATTVVGEFRYYKTRSLLVLDSTADTKFSKT